VDENVLCKRDNASGPDKDSAMQDSRLLTYTEAAKLLSIRKGTLYAWVHERRIPHLRLSKRLVRFDEATLRKWLADRLVADDSAVAK
jgi:excisionase family DNA binding protein